MKRLVITSLLISLVVGLAAYEYQSLPDVATLKKRNPGTTALMKLRDQEYRAAEARPGRQQSWVSYDEVSEHLKRAILISEDAAFFSHKGVDLFELKEAIKEDWEKGKFKRGGSTITMQLARNLYLSPSKNPLRKIREILIAWQLERALSKRRIFELYLNVVEWGTGIYGAEAAARHYFSKSALGLDPAEAATLAALLPSPRKPREKELFYRRNLILTRLAQVGYMSEDESDRAKNRPLWDKYESEPGESLDRDRPQETTPQEPWPGI